MKQKKISRIIDIKSWSYGYVGGGRIYPDRTRVKRLLSVPITDSKGLYFGIAELDPGDIHYLHHHEKEAEFYFVLHGNAKVVIDDEEVNATPGMCIFMPAGTKHRVENNGTETFVFLFGSNYPYISPPIWDDPVMQEKKGKQQ